MAKPRTPNEGSVYSGESVAGASCIDPSAHKGRGLQDDSVGDDPQYIVRLIGQVITVSVETVKIVRALPPLGPA